MEVMAGQTQRNMLMLLSLRTSFFPGNGFLLRNSYFPGVARFHGTIWTQNQADCKTFPLTLSSLGFGNKVEALKNFRGSKPGRQTNSMLPSNKDDTFGVQKKLGHRVREGKALGVDKVGNVRDLDPPRKVHSNKVKLVRDNKVKADTSRKMIETDAAIFAAKAFSELDLSPLLIKRLNEMGLMVPTEVQSTAIPTICKKHDVVIQSYTGSGKTFAYLLPILSEVGPLKKPGEGDESDIKRGIEAVIVAPSRELGMQIVREAEKLLGSADRKTVQQLVGGANRSRQEEALKKNKPSIVVGTPGRISEISAAGRLHTHGCRFLVLDEIDQLLSFNFREDMHRIIEHVGRRSGGPHGNIPDLLARRVERQLIMVSATVPFSVIRAARSWGNDPLLVKAKSVVPIESVSVSGSTILPISESNAATNSSSVTQAAVDSLPPALKHYYCVTKAQHKVDTLRRCIHALDSKSVITFMNHTKQLKDIVYKLEARGIKSAALHGDLGKLGRSTTLKNFKEGDIRVLVTNELSARGLDVSECDLVVNLDLPTDSVHYAHRAGRTGRLGRKGIVVTICEEPEVFVVKKLRRQLGTSIQACEFTEGKLILCEDEEEIRKSAEALSSVAQL